MKKLWQLFLSFFNIGLFTFGGGYAMLPMLQREVVDRHSWVTEEDMLDCYAFAQCTPGVIAVNAATFIGCKVAGILGGVVATLSVVLPSIVIISIIAMILRNFMEYAIVAHAFAGIRVAVTVLILNTVLGLFRKSVKGPISIGVYLAVLITSVFFNVSPVIIVLSAVLLGVVARKAVKDV